MIQDCIQSLLAIGDVAASLASKEEAKKLQILKII
jgi:hypothetical protein